MGQGDTLLVHAATGGVGHLATQIAVDRGARVIGTCSEPNHDFLRGLGGEPVAYGDGMADRVRELAPEGVDAGRLSAHVQSVHALDAVRDAVTEASGGTVRGKVVIRVP